MFQYVYFKKRYPAFCDTLKNKPIAGTVYFRYGERDIVVNGSDYLLLLPSSSDCRVARSRSKI